MPAQLLHTLPPKKKTNLKIWHPWLKEVQRHLQLEQMRFLAHNLLVNAVVPSEDKDDYQEVQRHVRLEQMRFLAHNLGVNAVVPSDDKYSYH
jgi:hypothetical protein